MIMDLQLAGLNKRLKEKQLCCQMTQEAKDYAIETAYDPLYGARPLRRFLQHSVETLIAKRILRGDVAPNTTLTVDVGENGLQLC